MTVFSEQQYFLQLIKQGWQWPLQLTLFVAWVAHSTSIQGDCNSQSSTEYYHFVVYSCGLTWSISNYSFAMKWIILQVPLQSHGVSVVIWVSQITSYSDQMTGFKIMIMIMIMIMMMMRTTTTTTTIIIKDISQHLKGQETTQGVLKNLKKQTSKKTVEHADLNL